MAHFLTLQLYTSYCSLQIMIERPSLDKYFLGLTPVWMMILVAVFFGIVILFCVLTLNTGRNAMQLEQNPNNQTMEKYVTSYLILQYLLLGTSVLVIMISVTTFLKYYL